MTLRPCPSCQRHIRVQETACPFCETSVAPIDAAPLPPLRAAGRAAVVFATAAAITVTGCPKKQDAAPPPADADVSSSGTVVAVYGPPPQWDEIHDATVAMPRDGGSG